MFKLKRTWLGVLAAIVCVNFANVVIRPQLVEPAHAAIAPAATLEPATVLYSRPPPVPPEISFRTTKGLWKPPPAVRHNSVWPSLRKQAGKKAHKNLGALSVRSAPVPAVKEDSWDHMDKEGRFVVAKAYHDRVCPWLERPFYVTEYAIKLWLAVHTASQARAKLRAECPPRPAAFAQNAQ